MRRRCHGWRVKSHGRIVSKLSSAINTHVRRRTRRRQRTYRIAHLHAHLVCVCMFHVHRRLRAQCFLLLHRKKFHHLAELVDVFFAFVDMRAPSKPALGSVREMCECVRHVRLA